jgi:hypothetical protein
LEPFFSSSDHSFNSFKTPPRAMLLPAPKRARLAHLEPILYAAPRRTRHRASPSRAAAQPAGPATPPPTYNAIDAQPLNRVVYSLFRRKMADALGSDSDLQGYPAIIDLTRRLNAVGSPRATQQATRGILRSLFPSWLPGAFKVGRDVQ